MKPLYLHLPMGYKPKEMPFRDRWCNALQSGIYRQGTQALKGKDDGKIKHCCLGVICELEIPESEAYDASLKQYSFEGYAQFIPEDTELSLFLGTIGRFPNGVFVNSGTAKEILGESDSLASMNDNGYTFDQIARVIKKVWYQPQY